MTFDCGTHRWWSIADNTAARNIEVSQVEAALSAGHTVSLSPPPSREPFCNFKSYCPSRHRHLSDEDLRWMGLYDYKYSYVYERLARRGV